MAGTFRQVAKATFLVSKKDGLSDEEFRKYYTEVHAPMALAFCKRHGVLDYSIVRIMFLAFYSLEEDKVNLSVKIPR